jgi:LysM repeat protein
MVEPEMVDFQLTIDTLKTQVRDAQRNVAELRAEIEARRQELADAQVARARLEGRVREAERRVIEARHVIELQREELLAARAERERVFRSSAQLQSRLKRLQKQFLKPEKSSGGEQGTVPVPAGASMRKGQKAPAMPPLADVPSAGSQPSKVLATPAALKQYVPASGQDPEQIDRSAPGRSISVKPGDTLWSIARTYGVDLDQLRLLNRLTDNRILVGQVLWLPENRASQDSIGDRPEIAP